MIELLGFGLILVFFFALCVRTASPLSYVRTVEHKRFRFFSQNNRDTLTSHTYSVQPECQVVYCSSAKRAFNVCMLFIARERHISSSVMFRLCYDDVYFDKWHNSPEEICHLLACND